MKETFSVKDKVDAVFTSMENMERASPPPRFYARLLEKMNRAQMTIWEKLSAILLLPRVAFSVICFIIIINAVVLYSKFSGRVTPPDVAELATSDEYSLASNSLYDLENEKP